MCAATMQYRFVASNYLYILNFPLSPGLKIFSNETFLKIRYGGAIVQADFDLFDFTMDAWFGIKKIGKIKMICFYFNE